MLSAGQSFGNYRILEQIGIGGMGAVYLAQHPLIGKKVALKVIHQELSANKEVITRFFNEARAANQIGNDHIVQIHDFGQTDDGQHFYIMEYIEGRTLARILTERRTLHAQRVLHISAQIAAGLGAAHDANIIHRDLKPDNVMLLNRMGDADFVKVLDFGLAKILDSQKQLTAIGVVLGTPQYMSPEACESRRDIDARSDVYSLGILMFQMLTGRVPFQGDSMGEVLVKQVTRLPPAPRALNPAVPPSVEQIVLRCLAKDRATRFPSMADLRQALLHPEQYLASSPPVVQAAGGVTSEVMPPKSTQFFHGAGDAGAAPSGPVGPQYDAPSNGPASTAYFAGAAPSAVARAAVAVTDALEAEADNAITSEKRPSHAARTHYAAPGASAGAPPPAAAPAHAARTQFVAEQAPGAPPPGLPLAPASSSPIAGGNGATGPDASTVYGKSSAPPVTRPPVTMPPETLPPTNAPTNAPPNALTNAPTNALANAPTNDRTAFMDPNAAVGQPPARPMPDLAPPTPAKNVTMAIAPPAGYRDHPPSSSWKLIAAVAIIATLGGLGILGFVTPGFFLSGDADGAAVAVDAGAPEVTVDATASPAAIDAAVKAATPDAAPTAARIEVDSDPPGAEVVGADGVVLATTPGHIELPIDGVERTLTFRHPRAESQTTTVTPTGPALIKLQLESKSKKGRGKDRGKGRGKGGKGKGGKAKGGDSDGTINPFK